VRGDWSLGDAEKKAWWKTNVQRPSGTLNERFGAKRVHDQFSKKDSISIQDTIAEHSLSSWMDHLLLKFFTLCSWKPYYGRLKVGFLREKGKGSRQKAAWKKSGPWILGEIGKSKGCCRRMVIVSG